MRVLVAADGNTVESPVARRFERARWYLIVDDQTGTWNAFQPASSHDRHAILIRAAEENVVVVAAGKIGVGDLQLMSGFRFSVVYAHNISARKAVEKLGRGELRALAVQKRAKNPFVRRRQRPAGIRESFDAGSRRGRHHLQQYGSRGH